jgi:hypothetical protein
MVKTFSLSEFGFSGMWDLGIIILLYGINPVIL